MIPFGPLTATDNDMLAKTYSTQSLSNAVQARLILVFRSGNDGAASERLSSSESSQSEQLSEIETMMIWRVDSRRKRMCLRLNFTWCTSWKTQLKLTSKCGKWPRNHTMGQTYIISFTFKYLHIRDVDASMDEILTLFGQGIDTLNTIIKGRGEIG